MVEFDAVGYWDVERIVDILLGLSCDTDMVCVIRTRGDGQSRGVDSTLSRGRWSITYWWNEGESIRSIRNVPSSMVVTLTKLALRSSWEAIDSVTLPWISDT